MLDKPRHTARVYYVRIPGAREMDHSVITDTGMRLLRYAVGRTYALPEGELLVGTGKHGKPYFTKHPEIHFNISNSGEYAALAVSEIEVGIDIQEKRVLDLEKLGRDVFSVDDYRKFLASTDRQDAFFREWVKKEAYVKWTGEGLLRKVSDIKTEGWYQFLMIDRNYFCALWAGLPLDTEIEEVQETEL